MCTKASATYPTPSCAETTVTVLIQSTPRCRQRQRLMPCATIDQPVSMNLVTTIDIQRRLPLLLEHLPRLQNRRMERSLIRPMALPPIHPNRGFVGNDSFEYEICADPVAGSPYTGHECATATVTVTISDPNLSVLPQATGGTTDKDQPTTIDILRNDTSSDPTNAPLKK